VHRTSRHRVKGSPAVRILLRLGAGLRALWAGLQGWQAGAAARADPGAS
jgi:hypothetical protein